MPPKAIYSILAQDDESVTVAIRMEPPMNGFDWTQLTFPLKKKLTPEALEKFLTERVAWKVKQQIQIAQPIDVEIVKG
jgi:hypothetical protein